MASATQPPAQAPAKAPIQAPSQAPSQAAVRRRAEAKHESFLRHQGFLYAKAAALICALAVFAYVFAAPAGGNNGGTWLGYTLGGVSALLILWLTALGLRKRAITAGGWSLKGWTSAHVYLGLSLLVIGTLHTAFQFGWNLHTLAYVLMVAVIVSGVFGIYYYATIPRRMSDNRGDMSSTQMVEEVGSVDADLRDAAQPLNEPFAGLVQRAIEETQLVRGPIARLNPEPKSCPTLLALEAVRAAARESGAGETLGPVLSLLERKQALLLRTRRYARFKTLLELWLYFHVPLTFALIAALTGHVISVFYFW